MLYLFLSCSVCLFLYGPFCHGAVTCLCCLQHSSFKLWTSLQFILYCYTKPSAWIFFFFKYIFFVSKYRKQKRLHYVIFFKRNVFYSMLCKDVTMVSTVTQFLLMLMSWKISGVLLQRCTKEPSITIYGDVTWQYMSFKFITRIIFANSLCGF